MLRAQKNRLIETVLLSTHNILFGLEMRKIFFVTDSKFTEGLILGYVSSVGSGKTVHLCRLV